MLYYLCLLFDLTFDFSKKSDDSIELEKIDPLILSNTRMNNLNLVAAAYTDVCTYSDNINDSFKILIRSSENRISKNTIRDIKVYNLLLKKYAESGNYRKVQNNSTHFKITIPLFSNISNLIILIFVFTFVSFLGSRSSEIFKRHENSPRSTLLRRHPGMFGPI